MNGPALISLSPWDLALAATLVLALAATAAHQGLALQRPLLVAALRTALQLTLIGLVLEALFGHVHLAWVALLAGVMLLVAGYEVRSRQRRPLRGAWGYGTGTLAMFLSAFSVTVLALTVLIDARPWYAPQYAIPLLGMLLGNTMTGVALALDRVTQGAWEQRAVIEGRLMLGADWRAATEPLRREAARSGLMPIINAMAAAGVVSLPGMMTGQILAGAPPMEAVKYQILIMFLIAGGTGFGTFTAVWLGARRLFDARQRLRLERLQQRG